MRKTLETSGRDPDDAGGWRLFDAAANRASEALRVLEDVARFMLDDGQLTAIAKALRHDLTAVLAGPGVAARVACRDTPGDVGTGIVVAAALSRRGTADLIAANAARAAQALRSLEEVALVVAPAESDRFQRLRYRLYTLERCLAGVVGAVVRLRAVNLCVLVDGCDDGASFERLCDGLIDAGVRMIQLRDKRLPVPDLLDRGRRLVTRAERRAAGEVLVVVNDRADVALAVRAAGVHVGADDLPVESVRRLLGPRAVVGRTAHSLDEARSAVLDGADYIGVGPCFPSGTKSFADFAPAEFLSAVGREITLPAFAIGGITLERLEDVLALGLRRVAVASAVTQAADPCAAAAAFIERLSAQPTAVP